jgi:D-methionine transport system ATP-binding protein
VFSGDPADRSIFTTLTRRFDVNTNILSGSVETVGDRQVGHFRVELEGAKVKQAIEYLHASFAVEVH